MIGVAIGVIILAVIYFTYCWIEDNRENYKRNKEEVMKLCKQAEEMYKAQEAFRKMGSSVERFASSLNNLWVRCDDEVEIKEYKIPPTMEITAEIDENNIFEYYVEEEIDEADRLIRDAQDRSF